MKGFAVLALLALPLVAHAEVDRQPLAISIFLSVLPLLIYIAVFYGAIKLYVKLSAPAKERTNNELARIADALEKLARRG